MSKSRYEVYRPDNVHATWADGMTKSRLDAMLQDLPGGWTIGRVVNDRIFDLWDKSGKLEFISHGGGHGEWRRNNS